MKKPIKSAFLFLFGLILISFLIQSIFYSLIKNLEVGEVGVINKIMDGQINSDIIICGASRAFVGINPKIIEKETNLSCYNIALNGSRLSTQVPLLKAYLKHNKKPKLIIQELGMYSLSLDAKIFSPYKYLPYLDENEFYDGLSKIDPNLWVHKYLPLSNLTFFNTSFQKLLIKDYYIQINNLEDYLTQGFHPNKEEWSINEENFLRNPIGIYNKVENEGVQLLNEIVDICKKENIKLIFINTPEYYKIRSLYKYRKDIVNNINKISEMNYIPFIDFTTNNICNEKSNFYNFTHLNYIGADKFSNVLTEEVLKLNL